jgi:predicted small lipoprotein YifL
MKIVAFGALLLASSLAAWSASPQSTLIIDSAATIPQAKLSAGRYTVVAADSMKDRKVIRVKDASGKETGVFLAAPNPKLRREGSSPFLFWPNGALRAWFVPGESVAAEAVYEKDEAVAIAKLAGEPVLAIDPESELQVKDRRLTKEELQVLNLWVLDFGPVDAAERKLAAAKYVAASWSPSQTSLPKTASPYGTAILLGALLMMMAGLTACGVPGPVEQPVSRRAPLIIDASSPAVECAGGDAELRAQLDRERRRNLQLELLITTLRKRNDREIAQVSAGGD